MRDREQEILQVLANCVRAMSVKQVARGWWSESRWGLARARRSLRDLADADWLRIRRVLSRPIQSLGGPLVVWEPENPKPDFANLSRKLHRRAMTSAEMTTIVMATSKTTSLFGEGSLPTIKLTQMTHDLHVAEVFLTYRDLGMPDGRWVGEDRLARDWPIQQRPDAVLRGEDGVLSRAVEYGGDYKSQRLTELHDGISRAALSYEIW